MPCSPLGTAHLQENGFPQACTRIPQLIYSELASSFRSQSEADFRYPCIVFQRQGAPGLGVSVGDILNARGDIRKLGLLGSHDVAFRDRGGDGQVKVRISVRTRLNRIV